MKIRPFPLFRVLTTQFRDGSSVFAGARRSRTYVKGGVACIGVGALAITPFFHPSSWFTSGKKEPETYQHEGQVGQGSTLETLMSWASAAVGNARSGFSGVPEKETKPDSGEQRSWTYIIRGMTTRVLIFVSGSIPLIYSGFTGCIKKLQTLLYRDSDEIATGNGDGMAEKNAGPDNGTWKYKCLGAVIGGVGVVVIASFALPAIGFTSGGIAAGSFAAKLMSICAIANGGGVAAGSTVAVSQSAGVLGLATKTKVIIWAAGSVAGFIAPDLFKKKDKNLD